MSLLRLVVVARSVQCNNSRTSERNKTTHDSQGGLTYSRWPSRALFVCFVVVVVACVSLVTLENVYHTLHSFFIYKNKLYKNIEA